MTINLDFPRITSLFEQHRAANRADSAAFLIWYLENYYRLDSLDATDSVVDQSNDKGIDGIYVNDNDKTIVVFQSTIRKDSGKTIGDKSLREFSGTLNQFADKTSLSELLKVAPQQIIDLIKKNEIESKISSYELRGEFVSNVDIDANGKGVISIDPRIVYKGKTELVQTYISDSRDIPIHADITFDIANFKAGEYRVDANTTAIIASIKASELVSMSGIADQSLFIHNVRGMLGRTAVNKEIANSIRDSNKHKMFPLFHNGITVIAKKLEWDENRITIGDYYVVNGCQSMSALFENQKFITESLRILTKIIKLEPSSNEVKIVTEFSNTQNGVRSRDFKSNDPKQIRLQAEFQKIYSGKYYYEIKRGENNAQPNIKIISNEEAGLLLMAFSLKEPWGTHRRYQVFEDKYAHIFENVTADLIVLLDVILNVIEEELPNIQNEVVRKYRLTKYALMYFVRNVFDTDTMGIMAFSNPAEFVRQDEDRAKFKRCVSMLLHDLVIDVNGDINDRGENFDYRNKLRDEKWIKELSKSVVSSYQKQTSRGRIRTFSEEWNNNAQ